MAGGGHVEGRAGRQAGRALVVVVVAWRGHAAVGRCRGIPGERNRARVGPPPLSGSHTNAAGGRRPAAAGARAAQAAARLTASVVSGASAARSSAAMLTRGLPHSTAP